MPEWKHTIRLADVFHNEAMTFEERRDAVAARIRASRWYADRDQGGFDEFGEAVKDLAAAEDANEFDEFWDVVYDQADADRVWIVTR